MHFFNTMRRIHGIHPLFEVDARSCQSTIHEHKFTIAKYRGGEYRKWKKTSTWPIVNKNQSFDTSGLCSALSHRDRRRSSPLLLHSLQHNTKSIALVQGCRSAFLSSSGNCQATSTSLMFIPAADGTVLPKPYLFDQEMTDQRAAQESLEHFCSQQRAANHGTPAISRLQARVERESRNSPLLRRLVSR